LNDSIDDFFKSSGVIFSTEFGTVFGVDLKAKKKEGKPLPDTPSMKMWREEYEQMPIDEHKTKLAALGLGDEDFSEFKEVLKEEKKKK